MSIGRTIVVGGVILVFVWLSLGALIRVIFWLTGFFQSPGNPGLGETAGLLTVIAFVVAFVTAIWTYKSMGRKTQTSVAA